MIQKDIYDLSEEYQFEGSQDGVCLALFAILKELKELNKTLRKVAKNANTRGSDNK